jgi:hypothetical protein
MNEENDTEKPKLAAEGSADIKMDRHTVVAVHCFTR